MIKKATYIFFFTVLLCFSATCVNAQLPLKLPDLLSDHAVLQKDTVVRLWGKGPGSFELKIILSWQPDDTVRVKIGPECTWSVPVRTAAEKGPHAITFICGNEVKKINDILLGDVWLCAGQSNMEYNYSWGIDKNDPAYQVVPNDEIRFFAVEQNYDDIPVSECRGKWIKCDAAGASSFSTVGYFFAKNIQQKIRDAVGMIGAYWGGTNIQAWMPAEDFAEPGMKQSVAYIEPYGWAPKGVSSLYNTMIYPLKNYRIKGCIWYQGEANVDWDWNRYAKLLDKMVRSWRNTFQTQFPFYAVEIAPWNGYGKLRAAALREQIQEAARRIPAFGSVGIADLVTDTADIHPARKKEVGLRLADLVLKEVYHANDLLPYPPSIINVRFKGRSALADLKSVGALKLNGAAISGFELAGADSVFYPASARLVNGNRLEISADKVAAPTALRYCFENASVPDLFDQTGLPLKQFRTDKYPIY